MWISADARAGSVWIGLGADVSFDRPAWCATAPHSGLSSSARAQTVPNAGIWRLTPVHKYSKPREQRVAAPGGAPQRTYKRGSAIVILLPRRGANTAEGVPNSGGEGSERWDERVSLSG